MPQANDTTRLPVHNFDPLASDHTLNSHGKGTVESPAILASLHRLWYDKWLSEIVHLVLGCLCLAAIAALLATYNDAALPLAFPLGLTLSACVPILEFWAGRWTLAPCSVDDSEDVGSARHGAIA